MSPRAAARGSIGSTLSLLGGVLGCAVACAVCAVCAPACDGQLRLEDDAGAPFPAPDGTLDAGGDLSDASSDAADTPDAARPPACTKDGECGLLALHCDVVSGTCVPCVTDDQCAVGAKHRCDAALHRCVECGVDGDCGMGRVCVPGARRCATSCQQLSDCVVLGDFCDSAKHICARCTDDSLCKADPDTPICSPVDDCVECVTDATCPAGRPRCDRTSGSCVQCLGASDCGPAAPLCNPTTVSCVSGP